MTCNFLVEPVDGPEFVQLGYIYIFIVTCIGKQMESDVQMDLVN